MSGGYFNGKQSVLSDLADEIQDLLTDETILYPFKDQERFKRLLVDTVNTLRLSHIAVQRIDYVVSGDDGEDTFYKRLEEELRDLEKL